MKEANKNPKITCIIDDDELFVNLVKKLLAVKKFATDVIIFKNGNEAINYFKKNNIVPDIIFLDLQMPVMDGWEFVNEFSLFQNKLKKPSKLYIVSSSEDPLDLDKAKKIECIKDFIPKPVTIPVFDEIYSLV